jgi:hypothetical protein
MCESAGQARRSHGRESRLRIVFAPVVLDPISPAAAPSVLC